MKVIVIGGGPAGMVSSIRAKENKNTEVILIEKNPYLGKKLGITGKGRCNITSSLDMEEFIKNTPTNGKFMYSAFYNFTNKDIIKLLDIPVKEERGNRIFPVSDNAKDVIYALENKMKEKGVKILRDTKVVDLIVEDYEEENNNEEKEQEQQENKKDKHKEKHNKKVVGVIIENNNKEEKIMCDKVILATGGKSYPVTGSTGDGYNILEKYGHSVVELKPSLVALRAVEEDLETCKDLQGLSLKNVSLKVYENKKVIYEDFGEMMFTHFGVTGPIILSASSHLVRTKMRKPEIKIDLKPALSEEKLNNRILRDFDKYKNKELKNGLNDLLPQKMIPVIIKLSKINPEKKINEITKQERYELINNIKKLKIKIAGFRPIEEAIVTHGGINTKEINPKTMESKIIKDLYVAGEVLDVDAYTGGFNLQIAYSTGFTAGMLL